MATDWLVLLPRHRVQSPTHYHGFITLHRNEYEVKVQFDQNDKESRQLDGDQLLMDVIGNDLALVTQRLQYHTDVYEFFQDLKQVIV